MARRLLDAEARALAAEGPPHRPEAARGADGDDASAVAHRVFAGLQLRLSEVVGPESFDAMFRRALDRGRAEHRLLGRVLRAARGTRPLDALGEALRGADPRGASEALAVVLTAFVALLGRLVGDAAAARLVDRPRPGTPPGSAPAPPHTSTPADPPVTEDLDRG